MTDHKCPAGKVCAVLEGHVMVTQVELESALQACELEGSPLCQELVSRDILDSETLTQLLMTNCALEHGDRAAAASMMADLATDLSRGVVHRCNRVSSVLDSLSGLAVTPLFE